MTRLTSSPGEKEEVTFSPDGRFVSFVRDNNIYVVDVATQRERQLTTDGNENIQNGILDWVYQEEVYGRGNFRAYWWSPDSTRIAYLQLDERPVKHFAVVDHIPYQQNVESELYPKAGAPNPIAKLFCVNVNGAAPKEIEHRELQRRRLPHRPRRLVAGQREGRLPDPESRADLARSECRGRSRRRRAEDALPRDDEGVGRRRPAIRSG